MKHPGCDGPCATHPGVRIAWFSSEETARSVVTQLLRTSADYGFDLVAYCVMPDHLHSLVEGIRSESNLRKYVAMFKQRTSFDHSVRYVLGSSRYTIEQLREAVQMMETPPRP